MKPILRSVLVVLGMLILTGCAFTKATLDVGLKPGDTGRGPLSSVPPMTVGIADLADKRPDTARIGYSGEDKDVLLEADITSSELIASMFPIVDPTVDYDDVKGARLAAARHGADAVMIVTGAADVDAYSNPLSLLYLTIVGMWIVPGSHRDALFAANATLWDVATGYLYASAEAEGRGTLVRPLLFIDDDEVIARARREALIALRDELLKRIRRTAR